MSTSDKRSERPQVLRNNENIRPSRSDAEATNGNDCEDGTAAENIKPKAADSNKRKANEAACLASPRKRARHDGAHTGSLSAASPSKLNSAFRDNADALNAPTHGKGSQTEQSTLGVTPIHQPLEGEKAAVESSSSTGGNVFSSPSRVPSGYLAAQQAALSSQTGWDSGDNGAFRDDETGTTYPTEEQLNEERAVTDGAPSDGPVEAREPPLQDHEHHAGQRGPAPKSPAPTTAVTGARGVVSSHLAPLRPSPPSKQSATGFGIIGRGRVIDRGQNPNLGPAGYDPTGRETPSKGLNRIIEEAVAAPRRPLPHVLPPLTNRRHPLPSAPMRKLGIDEEA